MANKVVYQVSQGNGISQFKTLPELVAFLGHPVSRKDILRKKHRGITLYEVDVDGNMIPGTLGGLPWNDPKYAEDYAKLGVELEDATDEGTTEDDSNGDDSDAVDNGDTVSDEPAVEDDSLELEDDEDTTPPVAPVQRRTTPATPNRTGIPVAVAKVNSSPVLENPEYPEVGAFSTEKDMKKYVKKLTDDQLQEWAELEGVEWKASDNQSINRMRMAMALKAKHGFGTVQATGTGKAKSKSKYADYETEQLVQMALDNDLDIKDAKGDMRILRMYTIMALRDAGVLD